MRLRFERYFSHHGETIKFGFYKGHPTTGIFLDVEKAFDNISLSKFYSSVEFTFRDFKIFLFKLTSVGLNTILIRWISNFLYQRKLILSMNDQVSDPITPIHAIPQGKPLSPFLFVLYASDIPQPLETQVD